MQARSCQSIQLEPYRAGLELGEELRPLQPEVVFIFPSIHYAGSPELLEGLYDGLDDDNVKVMGNTGDGVYTQNGCLELGVAALGLNSGGACQWHIETAEGVSDAPFDTTARCMRAAMAHSPALVFFGMDFRTDATLALRAIQEHATVPTVGGLASDDYQMKSCFLYAGREVLSDSIVTLSMVGDLPFAIRVGQTMTEVGKPGVIDKAEGCTVFTIDGLPAMDWVLQQIGRPFIEIDLGVVSLASEDQNGDQQLRSLLPGFDRETGAVRLYGHIEEGNQVRCRLAVSQLMKDDILSLGSDLAKTGFDPAAALVVSCAGRKQVHSGGLDHEVTALTDTYPQLAIAGYPSLGEFGPLPLQEGGYSRNLFHNMTYLLLCLGERDAGTADADAGDSA